MSGLLNYRADNLREINETERPGWGGGDRTMKRSYDQRIAFLKFSQIFELFLSFRLYAWRFGGRPEAEI